MKKDVLSFLAGYAISSMIPREKKYSVTFGHAVTGKPYTIKVKARSVEEAKRKTLQMYTGMKVNFYSVEEIG